MKCEECGCELVSNGDYLYTHEKSNKLVPGNSLSGWIYTDTKGHVCSHLWFGYWKNIGIMFTCVGYPHAGGVR